MGAPLECGWHSTRFGCIVVTPSRLASRAPYYPPLATMNAQRHLSGPLAHPQAYRFIRAHSPTLLLRIENEEPWLQHFHAGGACDSCKGTSPDSRPTPKGGAEDLHERVDHLAKHRLVVHIVDGPRGPAGIVEFGAIRFAQASGAAIVPYYVAPDRARYMRSWDRFLLLAPFSREILRCGSLNEAPPRIAAQTDGRRGHDPGKTCCASKRPTRERDATRTFSVSSGVNSMSATRRSSFCLPRAGASLLLRHS